MKKAKKAAGKRVAKPTKGEMTEVVQPLLTNLPPDKDAGIQYETLLRLLAKSRSAAGQVSAQKKKMGEMGFDVPAFMRTMRLENMDPLDLANHLQEMSRLGRLRGLPVQTQLFETRFDSAEDQARAEGYSLGKASKSADTTRWPEGTTGNEAHMAGWMEGQKAKVLEKAPAAA